MKCPKCEKKIITFIKWSSSIDSIKTKCKYCNTKLRADNIVYFSFSLVLLISFLLFPFLRDFFILFDVTNPSIKIRVFALTPIILVGAMVAWFMGGYKVVDKDQRGTH